VEIAREDDHFHWRLHTFPKHSHTFAIHSHTFSMSSHTFPMHFRQQRAVEIARKDDQLLWRLRTLPSFIVQLYRHEADERSLNEDRCSLNEDQCSLNEDHVPYSRSVDAHPGASMACEPNITSADKRDPQTRTDFPQTRTSVP
jgi:hypothetical protein